MSRHRPSSSSRPPARPWPAPKAPRAASAAGAISRCACRRGLAAVSRWHPLCERHPVAGPGTPRDPQPVARPRARRPLGFAADNRRAPTDRPAVKNSRTQVPRLHPSVAVTVCRRRGRGRNPYCSLMNSKSRLPNVSRRLWLRSMASLQWSDSRSHPRRAHARAEPLGSQSSGFGHPLRLPPPGENGRCPGWVRGPHHAVCSAAGLWKNQAPFGYTPAGSSIIRNAPRFEMAGGP
jgi:hypothetical protein